MIRNALLALLALVLLICMAAAPTIAEGFLR